MSLESLPTELQSEICSYLVKSFGPWPIHALLKTSKKLYDVALPFSVKIFRNTTSLAIGGGPCSETRNAQFLRSILVFKPELAKMVDTVILGGFATRDDGKNPEHGVKTTSMEELATYELFIINTLGQLSEPDVVRRDKWIAHLKEGHSDAQVALILLACSNLKRLYFEDYLEGPSENPVFKKPPCFLFLLHMAKTLSNNPSFRAPLSKLEHIHVQSQDDYNRDYEQDFRLMALPQVKVYETLGSRLGFRRGPISTEALLLPAMSSSVEEINLHQSLVAGSAVKHMARGCKSLRKLEYIGKIYCPAYNILARDILEAVLPHANTLEHLVISFDDECEKPQWREDPHRLYLGTELSKMTNLKSLDIGMQTLTGIIDDKPEDDESSPLQVEGAPRIVECLPEGLTTLNIRGCGKAILDQASELLRAMESGNRCKKLRIVRLFFDPESIDVDEIQLELRSPKAILLVLFQGAPQRALELGGAGETFEGIRSIPSLCSRIFADDLRDDWMIFRGIITTKLYPRHGSAEVSRGSRPAEWPLKTKLKKRMRRLYLLEPPDKYKLQD